MKPLAETLSSELLDIVDDTDRVVGSRTRGDIHRLGLKHRSVHVLVFSSAGELLLQKRSMMKDECRGMWDSSCAGHVESGQSYEETAPRELEEELGISVDESLQALFKMPATADSGLEFAMVYRTVHDGPFEFAEDEIDEIAWYSTSEIDLWVRATMNQASDTPQTLTSGFCEIWQHYREQSSS